MKLCKHNMTRECPFYDEDQGPPVPFTVRECCHSSEHYWCPHWGELHATSYKEAIEASNEYEKWRWDNYTPTEKGWLRNKHKIA